MKKSNIHPIAKAAIVCWSVLFFLLVLLGVWLGTGKDALSGPSTTSDDIRSYVVLGLASLQLIVAIALSVRYRLWLFRTFLVLVITLVCPFLWSLLVSLF